MSYVRRPALLLLVPLMLLSASPDPGGASSSKVSEPDFAITWWTVDGGGSSWIGALEDYRLAGSIGQPDAGNASDESWSLQGGFWSEAARGIFSDGFESGDDSAWSRAVGLDTSSTELLEKE